MQMRASLRRRILCCACLGLAPLLAVAQPLRVLFVGNSHTYTNDLPRIVAALATQRGVELETDRLAEPGVSLGDHLGARRLRRLLQRDWDWVVLQQGTSSLPESRRDLVASTRAVAELLRGRTTRIALISIWPQRRYLASSLAAEASYRAAAKAVDACVFPAATAWRLAQERGDAPRLYQPDQLHATRAGTVLMALTILPGLIGAERSGLESLVQNPPATQSPEIGALQAAAWQAHRDEPQRCEPR